MYVAQDRRYALLLGGFVEESAVLRLSAHSVPDAELSASVDLGNTRLTGTVIHLSFRAGTASGGGIECFSRISKATLHPLIILMHLFAGWIPDKPNAVPRLGSTNW